MPDLTKLKKTAFEAIEEEKESIFALSRYINEHPETAYNERKASGALCDFFSERDFDFTAAAGGVETAFTAGYQIKSSGNVDKGKNAATPAVPVAFIAEYDALEGIGHGCGHNLIAASAAATSVGTAAALRAAGSGAFMVIGTPAEEVITQTAGKNRLIEAGVFNNVGACLMFHPWTQTGVAEKDLGCRAFRILFKGRPAHAAADPWNGLNALDAAVSFYNSISMLRQQLPMGVKLHCILPDGGSLMNIIPDRASAEVMFRSANPEDLDDMESRIKACAEAASISAGVEKTVHHLSSVSPVLFNSELFNLAAGNAQLTGTNLKKIPVWEASSDFGDVSRLVPSLSLLYKTHDDAVCWHSRDVAQKSGRDAANLAMLEASKILSATAIDLIFDRGGF